jgi:hypothetical protein
MTLAAPRRVLEVAMEMALTPEILSAVEKKFGLEAAQAAGMSTSVGGIGPLLRERVIAQKEQGVDVVGVSLLYNTVWSQAWHDWNHLILERVSAGRALREILKNADFTLDLPLFDGRTVNVKVWKAFYGKAPWSIFGLPRNHRRGLPLRRRRAAQHLRHQRLGRTATDCSTVGWWAEAPWRWPKPSGLSRTWLS